jgi:hypothetical protein
MLGRIRRTNPATALALVAILLAVGGGDTVAAGARKASKLISGSRIKKGTIKADRLSPSARATLRGARGATGPQGPRGLPGIQGPKGDPGATGTVDTSNFFTKAQSDARYPQRGTLAVSYHGAGWQIQTADPAVTVKHFAGNTAFQASGATADFVVRPLDVPVAIDGKGYAVHAASYCYSATAGNKLIFASLSVSTNTDGNVSNVVDKSDLTQRTDATCRVLVLDTPQPLAVALQVGLSFQIQWSAASTFSLSRVVLYLAPIDAIAPAIPTG